MITHFQYKPLYSNKALPGWTFSFFTAGQKIEGTYHKNGKIEWSSSLPSTIDESKLFSAIHELMTYHEYDKRS
ncbi:YheE family protein [Bacillus fonticola]|uniref:YheE family protein n=1 Tax=Bacillus fonticola TaxID=2728853 RepID=UPI0014731A3D|nr:YheE family protein [Bacillus fonticola]